MSNMQEEVLRTMRLKPDPQQRGVELSDEAAATLLDGDPLERAAVERGAALKVLDLMGFDVQQVVKVMSESSDEFWKTMLFRSVRIELDFSEEPNLSDNGKSALVHLFQRLRRDI